MQFDDIEILAIEVLQEANEKYLFPYQIFQRIKQKNPVLADRIERAYPAESGKPIMGEGAGIYYSAASFVAHALNKFKNRHCEIKKQWFDAADLEIDGILPGNKEGMSIWAWRNAVET